MTQKARGIPIAVRAAGWVRPVRTTSTDDALKGGRIMMPYDTYQLYQIERAKSPAEVRRADELAGRLASAASSLVRGITRPWRAMRRPSPAATRDLLRPAD
jgi:hypothetical protein